MDAQKLYHAKYRIKASNPDSGDYRRPLPPLAEMEAPLRRVEDSAAGPEMEGSLRKGEGNGPEEETCRLGEGNRLRRARDKEAEREDLPPGS